jgi:hypothetical protein
VAYGSGRGVSRMYNNLREGEGSRAIAPLATDSRLHSNMRGREECRPTLVAPTNK